MKNFLILLFVLSLIFGQERSADIVIIAPTYTMDKNQPWADAVAIRGNKIIFVGDKQSAELYQNNSTHIIELPNGMVLPGFIDSHVHLLWGGIEMSDCRLYDLKTPEQIFQTLRDFNDAHPNDDWIRGGGWELPVFPGGNPRKEWLDEIIPDKPVFLSSADGHSAWVNSKALALAGINEQTTDPVNGRIIRDPKSKEPSGVLREDAMNLVANLLPLYTKDQIDTGLHFAAKEANRFGITAILDAGTGSIVANDSVVGNYDGLDAYRVATAGKQISLRVAASQNANSKSWKNDLKQMKQRRFSNELGWMNTVKLFADGVIEGGTAAQQAVYGGVPLVADEGTVVMAVGTGAVEPDAVQFVPHLLGD
jgi:predicted amidohydrolase YtcJ